MLTDAAVRAASEAVVAGALVGLYDSSGAELKFRGYRRQPVEWVARMEANGIVWTGENTFTAGGSWDVAGFVIYDANGTEMDRIPTKRDSLVEGDELKVHPTIAAIRVA